MLQLSPGTTHTVSLMKRFLPLPREQRILLVADRDFGELIFHQGLAHAGVIFFRLPGAPLQTKVEHLDAGVGEVCRRASTGRIPGREP